MLTVGEILKQEREKRGLHLSDIEKEIRVRTKFLKAIEENKWDIFTSKIYIEGVIKNYAELFELDVKKMLAFFRREYEKKEEITFRKRISSKYLTPETKKYLYRFVVFISLLFLAYFLYQLKLYLSPPKVEIVSPITNTFKKESRIQIIGRTEKEAAITIFGNRIYQNKNGVFVYDFPLKKGKNMLVIEVIGANGKKTVLKKEFFLNL